MGSSVLSNDGTKILGRVLRKLGSTGRRTATWLGQGRYDSIIHQSMPSIDSEDFPINYAAYNFLRKCAAFDVGIDRAAVATSQWRMTEDRCRFVNRLGGTTKYRPDRPYHKVACAVIHMAQEKIRRTLGAFSVDEWFEASQYSGGASTQRKRRVASIQNKYADNPHVTRDAAPLWETLLKSTPHYGRAEFDSFNIREYGVFSTVPKDAKTDRPIIIEPQGNMFFQKGLGSMIRKRLRRVGIDLNDQRHNASLATTMLPVDIATIDLSSASDLISYKTVELLLQSCPEWFEALLRVRTHFVLVDKELVPLQKFSGMGNGFTFELESLIFWALADSAYAYAAEFCGLEELKILSVYGDDIVVNTKCAHLLVGTLNYCGFSVNKVKSYLTGPFRESCGFHSYHGRDITPIYVKDRRFDKPSDWYWLYNSLRELGARLKVCFEKELSAIEDILRKNSAWTYVPFRYAIDSGIRASFDEARPSIHRTKNHKVPSFGGYVVRYLSFKKKVRKLSHFGAYMLWLRTAESRRPCTRMRLTPKLLAQYNDVVFEYSENGKATEDHLVSDRWYFTTTVVSNWD